VSKSPATKLPPRKLDDDDGLSIEEILPLDDEEEPEELIVDDFAASARCSIDDSYIISQFLSVDGYHHVNILYNLHSGTRLKTITAEVIHSGQTLLLRHALCQSFHNPNAFIQLIKDNGILKGDRDNDVRFCHLQEVTRLMKGESMMLRGDKSINLPFPCQQILCLQRTVITPHGESMLFMELRSVHQAVRDNQNSFADCVIEPRKKTKPNDHDDDY